MDSSADPKDDGRGYTNIAITTVIFQVDQEGRTSVKSFYGAQGHRACNITELNIPDGVEKVGGFQGSMYLKSVSLPTSVAMLEGSAFESCPSLESIDVRYVHTLGNHCLQETGIREIVVGEHTTAVPYRCFYGCTQLESVTLAASIAEIGSEAFYGCSSLEAIDLPPNIARLEGGTFQNCTALREIVIPEGVSYLANAVFSGCSSLASVQLPGTLTEIDYLCFNACDALKTLFLPASISSVSDTAMPGRLKKLELEDGIGITKVPGSHPELEELIAPATVTQAQNSSFPQLK